jgi:hypothetical protein
MDEPNEISTFSPKELEDYFDRNVEVPHNFWLPNMDATVEKLSVGWGGVTLNLGKLQELFVRWTSTSRYQYAACKWLRPNEPCLTIDDLVGLQRLVGLGHVDRNGFVSELVGSCREISRNHKRLGKWIRKRLALLEYITAAPAFQEGFRAGKLLLRHRLVQTLNYVWQGHEPDKARHLADELASEALKLAGVAAVAVFGKSKAGCRFSANLMLPVTCEAQEGPAYVPTKIAESNYRTAAGLWEACPRANKYLLVVAETERAEHEGFWVPVVKGEDGRYLPGAPEAFAERIGSAVFQDDLPPLVGFPKKVVAAWQSYIRNRVQERLFVSIPFLVPIGNDWPAIAVLNVNADPPDEDGWWRAYHREWLTLAKDWVAPFVEIARWAVLIKFQVVGTMVRGITIDTGSPNWDYLPVTRVPKSLPGGHHEH